MVTTTRGRLLTAAISCRRGRRQCSWPLWQGGTAVIAPITIMAHVAWIVFLLTMFQRAVRSFLGTSSTLIFPWVLASKDMVVALILVASIGISRINKTKDKAEEPCLRNCYTWGRSPAQQNGGWVKRTYITVQVLYQQVASVHIKRTLRCLSPEFRGGDALGG